MKKQGFTILELLVVMAIIAVVMSLLLPALAAARKNALNTDCTANLRSIGQILAEYTTADGGIVPAGVDTTTPAAPQYDWSDALFSFATSGPAVSRYQLPAATAALLAGKYAAIFQCPAADVPDSDPFGLNYAANPNAFVRYAHINITGLLSNTLLTTSRILRPCETIAVGDANQGQANGDAGPLMDWNRFVSLSTVDPSQPIPPGGVTGQANSDYSGRPISDTGLRFRHFSNSSANGSANALYFDGHVETMPYGMLRQLNVATSY